MACLGVLACFGIPVYLILSAVVCLVFLSALVLLVRDNLILARQVGMIRFLRVAIKSLVIFVPILILLMPGIWISLKMSSFANRFTVQVQAWAAPAVEYRPRKAPWWAPWRTEIEQIRHPKPRIKRVISEVLKNILLAISTYSTAFAIVLFARSYFGLMGRIIVVSGRPIRYSLQTRAPAKGGSKAPGRSEASLLHGSGFSIPLKPGEILMTRASDMPQRAIPDLSIFWRCGAFILRARRGLLMLNKVTGAADGSPLAMAAAGGFEYACIEIESGQEVVVDPDRLVGFSSTVSFRVHWDFSVAAIAVHGPVSLIATGPGLLVFKSSGSPRLHVSASDLPTANPSGLMLFRRDAEFEIQASNGLLNYYLSPCMIRPLNDGLFLTGHATPTGTSVGARIMKLIRTIYLPI